jgi:hypothetical protein
MSEGKNVRFLGSNRLTLLLRACAVILLATAALKLFALLSAFFSRAHEGSLLAPNVVFPIFSERTVLLLAVILEIVVALCVWPRPPHWLKFALVLYASALFYLYHSILRELVGTNMCKCLGFSSAHLATIQEDSAFALLAFLFVSGVIGLVSAMLQRSTVKSEPTAEPRSS